MNPCSGQGFCISRTSSGVNQYTVKKVPKGYLWCFLWKYRPPHLPKHFLASNFSHQNSDSKTFFPFPSLEVLSIWRKHLPTLNAAERACTLEHHGGVRQHFGKIVPTVRLLTHVLCKPTHFFFHSFIATMSYCFQTSFISVMKAWADKYHVWDTPTRSPSRSNSR